jgi:tRNA(Ile)-lysidine synthase TilS/MesJ
VALSGGTGSSSLLHFLLSQFGMRRDLSLVAITVDEGPGLSRDMGRIERLAKGMGIEWAGTSFAQEFRGIPEEGNGHLPGSCRDILRASALTSFARRVGATRIALGTTLENEARSVLLSVLNGTPEHLLGCQRPGEGGIPRIRPFLRIPREEVALYARLNLPGQGQVCLDDRDPQESEVRQILDAYADRHPAAMFSLVNLGDAMKEQNMSGPVGPHLCDGCRERLATACPARRILDEVGGHG